MTAELLMAPWEADSQRLWGTTPNGDPAYIASLKFYDDNKFSYETRDFLTRLLSSAPEMYEAILLMKRQIANRNEGGRWCDVLGLIEKAQRKWEGLSANQGGE